MEAETCEEPPPVFEGKRDLALYPDDARFLFRRGTIMLWGITFDVHEARVYTVAGVKASAAGAGGSYVRTAREHWERLEWDRRQAEYDAQREAEQEIAWREHNQLHPSRMEAMVAMHANGMTTQAIGDVFGLSRSRIAQLIEKQKRRTERANQIRIQHEANEELERQILAELQAASEAQQLARAKAKRAKRVVDLTGVEPATNWRTPQDEYLTILTERT